MNSKIVVESIYMIWFIQKKYYTPVESVKRNVPLGDHAFSPSVFEFEYSSNMQEYLSFKALESNTRNKHFLKYAGLWKMEVSLQINEHVVEMSSIYTGRKRD